MPLRGRASYSTAHPSMMRGLIKVGKFNRLIQIQKRTETRSTVGGTSYVWGIVDGMEAIPCIHVDRIPSENRTIDIIVEEQYHTFMLAGYYPFILPAHRAILDDPILDDDTILNIEGVDSDSARIFTILTCRVIGPAAEPGIG
jgi:head-tail adaptor